ncbi:hypothetical protein MSAN_02090900 [Mycena sanguinolenta]|uniref:Uncharacterized protein n=1 Tax=Mycena sanguinolenta TaxID=230812 RepID=A0A8H7CKH1_9AGAR|nr:hypothetical protein MSAN_02090900 [Mycena sanguinolenta]
MERAWRVRADVNGTPDLQWYSVAWAALSFAMRTLSRRQTGPQRQWIHEPFFQHRRRVEDVCCSRRLARNAARCFNRYCFGGCFLAGTSTFTFTLIVTSIFSNVSLGLRSHTQLPYFLAISFVPCMRAGNASQIDDSAMLCSTFFFTPSHRPPRPPFIALPLAAHRRSRKRNAGFGHVRRDYEACVALCERPQRFVLVAPHAAAAADSSARTRPPARGRLSHFAGPAHNASEPPVRRSTSSSRSYGRLSDWRLGHWRCTHETWKRLYDALRSYGALRSTTPPSQDFASKLDLPRLCESLPLCPPVDGVLPVITSASNSRSPALRTGAMFANTTGTAETVAGFELRLGLFMRFGYHAGILLNPRLSILIVCRGASLPRDGMEAASAGLEDTSVHLAARSTSVAVIASTPPLLAAFSTTDFRSHVRCALAPPYPAFSAPRLVIVHRQARGTFSFTLSRILCRRDQRRWDFRGKGRVGGGLRRGGRCFSLAGHNGRRTSGHSSTPRILDDAAGIEATRILLGLTGRCNVYNIMVAARHLQARDRRLRIPDNDERAGRPGVVLWGLRCPPGFTNSPPPQRGCLLRVRRRPRPPSHFFRARRRKRLQTSVYAIEDLHHRRPRYPDSFRVFDDDILLISRAPFDVARCAVSEDEGVGNFPCAQRHRWRCYSVLLPALQTAHYHGEAL